MKDLLPLAVRPPARGVADVLALPEAAHRLDKPTSGLLLVAKTRPALRHLSAQFRGLEIEKTYTAICYGVPKATHGEKDVGITEAGASNEGRLVGEDSWHLTDEPLDGKSATTLWRVLKHFNHGNVGLTLLELKPKTGRYRQLRRHMAKTHGCPLVGDSVFAKGIEKDGVGVPSRVAKLGLFLCSNAVRFEHPHFEASRDEWSESASTARLPPDGDRVDFRVKGSRVIVDASIRLPQRFDTLMERCDDFIGE